MGGDDVIMMSSGVEAGINALQLGQHVGESPQSSLQEHSEFESGQQ